MGHLLGSSMVGLMVTSSKKAYATWWVTQVCRSQSPCPCGRPLLTHASTGDTHSKADLAQSLWGLWVLVHTRFWLSPLSMSCDLGFDSKRDFAPPTIWLGFLLCPWTWGSFWWDPTFPCDGCSAVSYNSEILEGENECRSIYTAILLWGHRTGNCQFSLQSQRRQRQRMLKLPHNCTHLTHLQISAQNSPNQASIVREPSISRCSNWT